MTSLPQEMEEEKLSAPHSLTNEGWRNLYEEKNLDTSSNKMENQQVLYAEPEKLKHNDTPDEAPSTKQESKKDDNKSEKPAMSLPHEIAFVAIVIGAQSFTQSGLLMGISPMYIFGQSFNTQDTGALSWFSAAYSLTAGTFILPAGRLGDVYGHKKLFILGWIWFTVFSLLCGFSVYVTPPTQAIKFFDVMRALQGIGPAILLPNAIAIFGRTYVPGKRKNMVFSLFGATAPGGALMGAVFAALLSETAWWPWAFWIMGIATFLMGVFSVLVIPESTEDGGEASDEVPKSRWTLKERWENLDGSGTLIGVVGLVLINIAWNQAPLVGWPTTYIYVLLIIGFLFMFGFFYIEYTATHPLIPLRSIGRDVGFVLGCLAFGWSSFGIWLFYLWQMWLVLRHQTPLLSAAELIPVAISGLCAAITTGLVLHKIGPGPTMLISVCAFCAGNILFATMPVKQIYWAQTFVGIIVMPWGMDMSFPSGTIITSNSMPREHQGMAASLVTTVVNYSISLGLGFAGTVESRILANGGSTLEGYRSAWYLGIGLAGLGIVLAVLFNLVGSKESKPEGEGEGVESETEA